MGRRLEEGARCSPTVPRLSQFPFVKKRPSTSAIGSSPPQANPTLGAQPAKAAVFTGLDPIYPRPSGRKQAGPTKITTLVVESMEAVA
jgi:hypothetical protein